MHEEKLLDEKTLEAVAGGEEGAISDQGHKVRGKQEVPAQGNVTSAENRVKKNKEEQIMNENKTLDEKALEDVAGGITVPIVTALGRCPRCGMETYLTLDPRGVVESWKKFCPNCHVELDIVQGSGKISQG